jgi:transcriptional regulator with XRE-family HTH domain
MQMKTLAERVTKAIETSGHNASSVARQIGCSPEAVLQWMSGSTKNIKNDFLFALADLTNFNARWLGTGDGPEINNYAINKRIQHVVAVMEKMPDVVQAEAVKEVDSLAEFAAKLTKPTSNNGTDG